MKSAINKFLFFLSTILVFACSSKQELFVDYSNDQVNYEGRIDSSEVDGAELIWSGTSIKLNFEGESISGLFRDETGDNYYNVIIDGDSLYILRLDTIKRFHLLASNLSKGKHTIEIFKRNEWNKGKTSFYGFKIEGQPKLLPKDPPANRKIEFFGNSITAGYGVEDFSGKDNPDSSFTNNYVSYAAITARHFEADYHCTCKSGIGVTVSWFPQIMPEIYDRIDPRYTTSIWDFSLYIPDVVVVNLLQNDSWIVNMPEFEEYKARFLEVTPDGEFIIDSYEQFIAKLRGHYPDAHIICSLGCMDASKDGSVWMDYVSQAVENLKDDRIYTHFMPYIEAQTHPSIQDHEIMANGLIGFIEDNINW